MSSWNSYSKFRRNQILENYKEIIDSVLILAIKIPGFSGQKFNMDSLNVMQKFNKLNFRNKIIMNVDGGINNQTIRFVDSENVVSGSYVLGSETPKKNIKILQTSSQYEPI